ncbi:MAG: hypothetical protein IT373_27830 [Polyangiaceae bacterium]|nr:hypothetical protein [Polyangiaceae bacterium]
MVDERGPFHGAAVSPDGLLIAFVPRDRSAVLFYDLDRGRPRPALVRCTSCASPTALATSGVVS